MAEEKKDPPKLLSNAKTPYDWIIAFYGDDAIDDGKKNKVRHILRVCEFADVVAVVTKNSKQAHTDFFESTYTAVDSSYVKAAELIVRLLDIKYREGRPLTKDDFRKCGGAAMFDGRDNFDQICEDYIGKNGLVGTCEITCFPSPKTDRKNNDDLRRENEDLKQYREWLKNASDDEIQERYIEKKRLMFGSMVADIDEVKSHHTQILSVASESERNNGALNASSLIAMCDAATDKSANMYRENMGQRSAIDFTIKDDVEKNVEIAYNLAENTGKMALLGGGAVASLGAMVGGVFWPAFLIIPTFALAKRWGPDWLKSLGATWGHFKKSMSHKYQRQKIDSYHHYLVSFMETGGKPKLRLKDRLFLTPNIIKCLKKGAKSGSVGASFEATDGVMHVSEIDRYKENLSRNEYLRKDKSQPVDKRTELENKVREIVPNKSTFDQFIKIAEVYSDYQGDLDSATKLEIQKNYASKLGDSAEHLIFETPMKSMSWFSDTVKKNLADDGKIMSIFKDAPGFPGVGKVARLREFASKELAGLNADDWKDKTFGEFIHRTEKPKLTHDELVVGLDLTDSHVANAISYIEHLKINPKDSREVVSQESDTAPSYTLAHIQEEIGKITDPSKREKVNKLLKIQMDRVFAIAIGQDRVGAYNALVADNFTCRYDLLEIFKKIGEMKYENVNSSEYTSLRSDLTKDTRVSPPEMGRYLCGKIAKAAVDVFYYYLTDSDNKSTFRNDLPFLIEYLSKLNNNELLNQQQKDALTQIAIVNVKEAFDKFVMNMSGDFVTNYNYETIRKYLENDYADKGLKPLFEANNSSEVQDVKNNLTSLFTSYSDIQTNLKFGGKDMCSQDKTIISKILLRDETKGFAEAQVRDSSDDLVKFLSGTLKVSKAYTKTDFASATATNMKDKIRGDGSTVTAYSELRDKLSAIDAMSSDCDKYAAIVALKNKAICEFRKCLVTLAYTFGPSHGGVTTWLTSTGIPMYDAAIAAWSTGGDSLFEEIDKKMDEIHNNILASGITGITRSELLSETEMQRYTGTYTINLSEESNLGISK